VRSVTRARLLYGAGLLALIVLSLFLRTREMGTHFWIDEGLSIGIARHGFFDIPGILVQDGSPPLYYMLLHLWIGLVGAGEAATHWLSLIFALACIPIALWAGTSLFDQRVGWVLAGLTAINPFLTSYAQETRMYSLVILLSLLATAFYLHAYVYDRRGYRIPFGVALALLLYTHNWGLFLTLAFLAGIAIRWFAFTKDPPQRRRLLKDAAIGFGAAAILYLPWVPSLISQTLHTGAPWAEPPGFATLIHAAHRLLGGFAGTVIVILAAGAGLGTVAQRGLRERRVLVPALAVVAITPIVIAWVTSQVSPAWATRYLAIAVAPLLVLAALGLTRAGRLGVAGLAILTIMWLFASAPGSKSNAHYVAYSLGGQLDRGDLVISTQPEQVPVLSLYIDRWRDRLGLPGDVTYATPFGIQKDTGITDWRDGAEHFDRTGVNTQLMPLLDKMPVGSQVMLVTPIISRPKRWTAPWTSRVAARSIEYEGILRGDPRFELTATVPEYLVGSPGPNPLQGLLFRKYRNG
jgi:hypothetical protein